MLHDLGKSAVKDHRDKEVAESSSNPAMGKVMSTTVAAELMFIY